MDLLERDQHFEQLALLWRAATSSQGRIVLVSGEVGIGKTALIEQFVHQQGQATCLWDLRRLLYSAPARTSLRYGSADTRRLADPPSL